MKYAENVGILALDCYFPKLYVSQSELEKYDGVSSGKYTIGLGQEKLAFTTQQEDVVSMALTVMEKMMKNYHLKYEDIGRLEVATETIQDHSKSIKTFLMQLFEESQNFNVEGVDSMNACYAATNALFNSVAWVQSGDWNEKLAVVISVDIAEYAKGPARPTGGCGAVAFAVGAGSELPLELQCRFSHMEHVFDFYKPHLASPYPVVDGHYSNVCYFRALDKCYNGYVQRFHESRGEEISLLRGGIDYIVFHSPYNKLVQKSIARVLFNDFLRYESDPFFDSSRDFLSKFSIEDSYTSRDLMNKLVELSHLFYVSHVEKSTEFPVQLGNGYTSSVYLGLMSLFSNCDINQLTGKRILIFSYGSGSASSMFSFKVNSAAFSKELSDPISGGQLDQMIRICKKSQTELGERKEASPIFFDNVMARKELDYCRESLEVDANIEDVNKGAFYLVRKDSKGKKIYQKNG